MQNFDGFGLHDDLNKSLRNMDYSTPTPIQAQAIPLALKGHDVLGSAQTGTGKTAAFSIPMIQAILESDKNGALVLTPTRELAKQVLDVVHQLLGHKSRINTAFIIGGEPMGKQLKQLQARPRIIVGTPGRINDHLERGTMSLNNTRFLVLDETDRMLDMGFGIQLDRIANYLPKERQTLMFSATMPREIVKLSSKYLSNPERVSVGDTNVVAKNIETDVIRIDQSQKYTELTSQLNDRTGSVIIFIKTKHGADRMAKNLRRDGFTSEALHGDLRQTKRDKVMQNFRKSNFRILVATDIAARGLDVPHIEHVINYDLPQVAEDFIHRMGRTARAGASGSALSFVSPQEGRQWHAIECLLDPDGDHGKPPKEEKRGRKAPYRGRASKASNDGYKKDFKKRDDSRNDSRGGSRDEKKPYGKKPFVKRDDSRDENKSYGKKPYGKKPFNKSNDDRSEGNAEGGFNGKKRKTSNKPFRKTGNGSSEGHTAGGKFEGKKKPYAGKKKSFVEKKHAKAAAKKGPKKPYVSKSGEKPMKRTFADKKKPAKDAA